MEAPDWTLTRSFLAVVETGSLSAAARALGLSQPTLGRHIQDLETQLGLGLFIRQPRGLAPSEAALALIPHARAMRDAAAQFCLAAAAREEAAIGTVRITASRVVSQFLLPPMLAALRLTDPGIQIELVPSDSSENLLFREADIALRMYKPTQPDLISSHVCDLPMALYAAHSQIARQGAPKSVEDLLAMDFVGMDKSDLILRTMQRFGIQRRREDFPVRCDDQLVHWNLVRAGCGIGGMQRVIGDADPGVTLIAPFLELPPLPVWLTAPAAMRQSPRIRRVFDALGTNFRALAPSPAGRKVDIG